MYYTGQQSHKGISNTCKFSGRALHCFEQRFAQSYRIEKTAKIQFLFASRAKGRKQGEFIFYQRGGINDLLAANIAPLFVVKFIPCTYMFTEGWQKYSINPSLICMHMLNSIKYLEARGNAFPDWYHKDTKTFWNFCVGVFNYARQNYSANLQY